MADNDCNIIINSVVSVDEIGDCESLDRVQHGESCMQRCKNLFLNSFKLSAFDINTNRLQYKTDLRVAPQRICSFPI